MSIESLLDNNQMLGSLIFRPKQGGNFVKNGSPPSMNSTYFADGASFDILSLRI